MPDHYNCSKAEYYVICPWPISPIYDRSSQKQKLWLHSQKPFCRCSNAIFVYPQNAVISYCISAVFKIGYSGRLKCPCSLVFWWVHIDFHGSSVISKAISTTKVVLHLHKKPSSISCTLCIFGCNGGSKIALLSTTGICYAFLWICTKLE